jgi:hypothetical protein
MTPGGAVLYLEDETGNARAVAGTNPNNPLEGLALAFGQAKTPPSLVFLSACESAQRSRFDSYTALAPGLIDQGGVQGVVAMSGKVGVDTARQFTSAFYQRLFAHGVLDLAANEARALVQHQWDWAAPVVFSRLEDNQIIDYPIGGNFDPLIERTGHTASAVGRAIAAAQHDPQGGLLSRELRALVAELSKSHEALVKVAGNFRRTGADPATFRAAFESFYFDFKDYYDNKVWASEDTSCSQVRALADRTLPRLRPLLDAATFAELERELNYFKYGDSEFLVFLGEALDKINAAADEVYTALVAGDVDGAIQRKLAFEATISPLFRRAKELIGKMSSSAGRVSRA